jgi:8-oxo-dGTP pyrophosphatase MutT (NUDIX family)
MAVTEDPNDHELIPAATVLLLRDEAAAGLEVLMLRRNSKLAFGGMWVFPGGRVDSHEMVDGDVLASARVAAVRETEEETGLRIAADRLVTWSYWVPPPMPSMPTKGPRRRFSTWFFASAAPGGAIAIDYGEIHEDRWLSPGEALSQHRAGEIELAPPTWVTLTQLSDHGTVNDALAWAATTEPAEFRTKPIARKPVTICWAGDAAYETGRADTAGDRHRLVMAPDGWIYERSGS